MIKELLQFVEDISDSVKVTAVEPKAGLHILIGFDEEGNGTIIKQLTPQQTKLIGYSYEVELTAPVELHEIGYYSGFGHLNSQRFGCVGVKEEKI